MGNKTSYNLQETPLAPQRRFPRVINTRFVLEHVTTLRLPFGFWTHTQAAPLSIIDEDMGVTLFQISAAKDKDPTYRRLLDKNGVPVVELVGFPLGIDYAMYVARHPTPVGIAARAVASAGEDTTQPIWQASRALCYLQTNTRPLEKRLLIELQDPVTRAPVNIRVEGMWQNHEALFWLDRGLKAERQCIARVYVESEIREYMKQQKKDKKRMSVGAEEDESSAPALSYCVGIAPGVDVAMVLLACAAMDEALATKESGKSNADMSTDEITQLLAQRHHGTGDRNKWRSSTLVTAADF